MDKKTMEKNEIVDRLDSVSSTIYNVTPIKESLDRMTEEQLNYFCDEVATSFLKDGQEPSELDLRSLEYIAKVVENGKDAYDLLLNDYKFYDHLVDGLEDLHYERPKPRVVSEERRLLELKILQQYQHINEMIDRYVLHTHEERSGYYDTTFCQSVHGETTNIPVQGWKIHISADDLDDYERLLEVALPEFDEMKMMYKVVRPESLYSFNHSDQQGKIITIYPTPDFDVSKFSPQLRQILSETCLSPIGDMQIDGRMFTRYGNFRGFSYRNITSPNGMIFPDKRHEAAYPQFIKDQNATPQQILDFYSECQKRYSETGDFKRYLQEAATMAIADESSRTYVTLVIDDAVERAMKFAEFRDENSMSFVYKINGQAYAMLHNGYADAVLDYLEDREFNTQLLRPEWDKRFNVYTINKNDISKTIDMIEQYNSKRLVSPAMPEMSFTQLENGDFLVKVDSCLNLAFAEQCVLHEINVIDEVLNLSELEFGQYIGLVASELEENIQHDNSTEIIAPTLGD